jgi:5-(carboxyamino)imidazole ribonucleotide mutase
VKVIILFGSQSDERIYQALRQNCQEMEIESYFEVASAHRQPERVSELLALNNFDAVLAGAGLAAHLPGVVASHTLKPVIGIPVNSQFGGIDSVCSIVQMPYGIPVAMAGVNDVKTPVEFLAQVGKIKQFNTINIVCSEQKKALPYFSKELSSAADFALELGVELTYSVQPLPEFFNIQLHGLWDGHIKNDAAILHVPVVSAENVKMSEKIIDLHRLISRGGIWMGTNNLRNAMLFAARFGAPKQQLLSRLLTIKKGEVVCQTLN